MEILALLLIIAAVSLGMMIFGLSISILYNLAIGLVIGGLARFVLPGREKIGLLGTALIGTAGGAIGGLLGKTLHVGQFLELGLSVGVAAALLTALGFREKSLA